MSEPTLTLTQAGIALNVIGIAIALLIAMAIAWLQPRPYFRAWTWHYAYTLVAIGGEFVRPVEQPGWVMLGPQVAAYWLATHYLFVTSWALRHAAPPRAYWFAVGLGGLVSAGQLAAGVPMQAVVLMPLVMSLVAHAYLAVTLWGLTGAVGRIVASLLLGLLALSVLYPVVVATPFAALGFAGMGLLQVLVGAGMAVFVLDESERRLRRQHAELQALDALKTNFLATVSHELRTPLTVIAGAGQLLQDGDGVQAPYVPLVNDIVAHADRLAGLINDMLDASTMELGAMRYHPAPTELERLVAEVSENLRPTLERAGLSLDVEVPETPVVAPLDASKMAQVLTNLLTNAAKFTPAGGEVAVRLHRSGDEARLEVADTGIGLPSEEAERIFETFYQVDGGSTREAGGAGLGLAICRQIVEDGHGGRIWVESEPGVGSTFIVTLAIEAAPDTSAAA